MVRGLDVFQEWFAGFADQYVLIGGTAATLTMESAGLTFRATKDLDVVLHVEALTPAFGERFWKFVETAGYELRHSGDTGRSVLYRFQRPTDVRFPEMVELFARAPDALRPLEGRHLVPIPFEGAVSSLSAILLDDDYYAFLLQHRREVDGFPWIGEEGLIPLKAAAWLDLSTRKASGAAVDSKDIRKHINDVLRLAQLFTAQTRVPLPDAIARDMRRFLETAADDPSVDPAMLGLGRISLADALARISKAYGL